MSITNRTPHPITILAADGIAVVASYPAGLRGEVARVETTTEDDGRLDGVPVMRTRWGQIVGLPTPAAGAYHIVSVIVAEAAIDCGRGADDLLVPGDQVRDQQGRIVGCRGLTRAASSSPALAGQRGYKAALAAHRRTDPEALNLRPEPECPAVELEYLIARFDAMTKAYHTALEEGGLSYRVGDKRSEAYSRITRAVCDALDAIEFAPAG
jgi:hypothetical protein